MKKDETPIEKMVNDVEMTPIVGNDRLEAEDTTIYATHTGILKIGDASFEVVQLSDGRRIITEESIVDFFGGSRRT